MIVSLNLQKRHFMIRNSISIVLAGCLAMVFITCQTAQDVDYASDIKPLLNKKCLSCHGGVKQNAGFSLLTRERALADTDEGRPAIIPGNASGSEMIRRLYAIDPEVRMPLDAEPLTTAEIEMLTQWIDQGVAWERHWSYRPVTLPETPGQSIMLGNMGGSESMHPIDQFVNSKLVDLGLKGLSVRADRAILLRRIALDVIGMPAAKVLVEDFEKSDDPNVIQQWIDTLLASPQFGEAWASIWLDLARYADSKGYERDPHRNIWQYRDWLIRSLNRDLPYDQFLIEQLAGDMLPDPTDDQLLATAFHRNTTTNDEGGTDNEEFRTYAVMDRVNTTWEALMGTTFGCVQCHSHPYDPIMHKEYYRFLAFFNNSRDSDTARDYPLLRHFDSNDSSRLVELIEWTGLHLKDQEIAQLERFLKTWQPAWHSIETDSFTNAALYDTKYLGLRQEGISRLPKIDLTGKRQLFVRYRTKRSDGKWSIRMDNRGGPLVLQQNMPNTNGQWEIIQIDMPDGLSGVHDLFFHYVSPSVSAGDDNPQITFDWFRFDHIPLPWNQPGGTDAEEIFWKLLRAETSGSPVMIENPPDMRRKTQVFDRGNWLVKGEEVSAGVPEALGNWSDSLSMDRLGLAKWMTNEDHPLTARVWVNRVWSRLFGRGLVETAEDFGSQGQAPSHPQLLDWLAWQFMHKFDWSTKRLIKEIMQSATYQQQSYATPDLLEKDPYNIFLSRGPRVRLTAEQVRDQALMVSELLNPEMYGPSVMPYQPVQWNIPYSNEQWKIATDGQQYRRAVYTYWKRTSPYPAMMIYDAAAREVCSARRIQTNTPLHALVTLNDPVYVEAAAHFGELMFNQPAPLQSRLAWGYQRLLGKEISSQALDIWLEFYDDARSSFVQGESDEHDLLSYLDRRNDPDLGAMIMVANAMMNIDEFIMKN